MRIENTSRIADTELRAIFQRVLKSAPLGKSRRWLTESPTLFVTVHNAKYSRVAGRCYPSAVAIYRKGKEIRVGGYIKLFIRPSTTIKDIARTFAHELAHFKDWYYNVPRNSEKRAKAFADRVVSRL